MSTLPTLGYWDIRGLAQPIRNLLKLAGVEFNNKLYQFGHGSSVADLESVAQHWYKEKFTHGLDFPNLPYWIDGDVKLTQSLAILKYLARKHGMIAKDIVLLAKQEMVEQQLNDFWRPLVAMGYADFQQKSETEFQEQKNEYEKTTLPQHLEVLNNYLGDNQWFTTEFSYVDVLAYELIDWFRIFSPNTVAKYSNLVNFLTRFENLPMIKQYFSSDEYKNWPLFSSMARWGYWK